MVNPYNRSRNIFEKFGDKLEGQSQTNINLGVFINDRICEIAFDVIQMATEMQNLTPEMKNHSKPHMKERYKTLNTTLPILRQKYILLVNSTRAHFQKTAPNNTNLAKIINKAEFLNRKPAEKGFPLEEYIKNINDYFDQMVLQGLIPITVNYQEEAGMNKLFKQ